VDKDHLKDQKLVITKDAFTLKGEATFVMKYELDAKKKPVALKLIITESPFGAGATGNGVIELDGDTLKICYAPLAGEAPNGFEAKEGSKHHLSVLKQSK
jgi:uncharacterized protein (TIGR03067 family)